MKKPNTSIVASAIALAAAFAAHGILAADYYHRGDATANQAAQYDGSKVYRLAELTSGWYTDNECNNSAGESVTPGSGDSIYLRNGTFNILDGDALSYVNYRVGQGWDSYCTNNIYGGSLTLPGLFSVGYWDNGHGTVNMSGGTVSAGSFEIPTTGGSGCKDAHWNQTGGDVTTTGDFRIASNGNGTTGDATIGGGTVTVGGIVALATESGSTATMTVTNATVAATGIAYIGRSGGTGTLTVGKGASFSSLGDISVGSKGGTGRLVVDGGDVISKYWLTTGRDEGGNKSEIIVKSGSLKVGQYGTDDGQIDLSCTANSETVFKQSDGFIYAPGSLALSNHSGGKATYEMTGGTLELGGVLDVACSGAGTFAMSNGTVTASKYMRLGYGANSVANVYISGGNLTAGGSTDNKNYYGLMLADNASSTATFTIDGGTATFIHDSNIGWNGSGTLNIGGTGKLSVGTASAHKWVRMNAQAAATGKSVINLSGNGILDICHVELDNGMGEINFDGGAIHAYANNGNCGGVVIAASDKLTVNVKAGGATFDVPSGVAVSIAEPLLEDSNSTGGGLTKAGTGTLTLADGNTYTGVTAVNEGMLVLGTGTYGAATVAGGALLTVSVASVPSAITIADRGLVLVDVSSLELTTDAETAINLANITLPEGATDPAHYVAPKGQKAVFTFTQSGDTWTLSSARLAAEGESVVNMFLGNGAGTGEWRTKSHWSLGVTPTAVDTAVLPFSGTVDMVSGGDQTASNVVINTSYVKFNSTNGWPSFGVEEITGVEGATLALQTVGLKPASGKTMKVYVDCDCVANNVDQDTWFDGNDASSRLEMYGNLYATNSPFRINGHTDIYGKLVADRPLGDDNYINADTTFQPGSELVVGPHGEVKINAATAFQGNVTVDGILNNNASDTTFATGTVLGGSGTLNLPYRATIAADIDGALNVNLTGWSKNGAGYTHLSGDNTGFTGILTSRDYHICVLDTINSSSADATWNISTDFRYQGTETGTLKFGVLNLSKVDWSYFYITKGLEGLIIEVGAKNEDMTWGSGYCFGTYNSETDATSTSEFTDALIRKVGTGTLYTYADHYSTIEMDGGVVAMQDSHGPGTSFIWKGGTLRFDAAYDWDPSGRFDFANSTAAIDIDTAGNSFTWGTAFTGANGITKRGEGSLYLTGAHTYTGVTKVLGGELILPYRDFGAALEVADGAELALDMESATIAEGTPTAFGTAADDGTADRIVFSGADWAFTVARDEATGALSYTAASNDDSVPNRWIGGAAGSWSLAGNWSRGLPTATQTVRFDSDAAVTLDGSKTVSNIVNNAYVQFRTTNTRSVHPTLYIREVNGTGTNALWHAGFIANGLPGTIAAEATVEILNCGNSDSWLEGDYAASPLKIYGNVCGAGYLICRDYVYFYGDNSGHTANVLMERVGEKHFVSVNSGFPASAKLEIQGSAYVDVDGVTFGALNISERDGFLGINVPEGFKGTVKVGANDKDATIGNTMSFFEKLNAGGWNTGCANATIEKTGAGTLHCGLQNACKIQVTAGTVEFTAANTAADITVAAGAAITGGVAIKAPVFEPGAILRQTVTRTADAVEEGAEQTYTYSCPTFAATGAVNVGGVVCELVDTFGYLATATKDDATVFTLLTATTVAGQPTGHIDIAEKNWGWNAKRAGNGVVMKMSVKIPGFFVIIH